MFLFNLKTANKRPVKRPKNKDKDSNFNVVTVAFSNLGNLLSLNQYPLKTSTIFNF